MKSACTMLVEELRGLDLNKIHARMDHVICKHCRLAATLIARRRVAERVAQTHEYEWCILCLLWDVPDAKWEHRAALRQYGASDCLFTLLLLAAMFGAWAGSLILAVYGK